MSKLPIVCDGKQLPVVDLIAVPSLPQIHPTYADNRKECSQWLREAFTHRFPRARVMPFLYDFDFPKERITWADIMSKSTNLLWELAERRKRPHYQQLPIVFVCHSFGGLVLKNALKIAEGDSEWIRLFDLTRGIVFMACPHDERRGEFEDCCIRCAAVELGFTKGSSSLLKGLRGSDGWSQVRKIEEWFRQITWRQPFSTMTFYEKLHTTYQTHRMRGNDQDVLCSAHLARLDFSHAEAEGIDMNHTQLTSFPEPTDHFYNRLLDAIQSVMDKGQIHGVAAPSVQAAPVQPTNGPLHSESESIDMIPEYSLPQRSRQTGFVADIIYGNTPCFMLKESAENPSFVGRDNILTEIKNSLLPSKKRSQHQSIFALCGLGGIGKTQIAMRLVNDAKANAEFRAILWARADTRSKLADDFTKFAVKLSLVDENILDQNEAREALKTWFRTTTESWLIVFDNADGKDKEALMKDFRPTGSTGSILITSRDPRLAKSLGGQEVHELDSGSAVDMLWRLTKSAYGQEQVPSPPTQTNTQDAIPGDTANTANTSSTASEPELLGDDGERNAAARIVRKLGFYPLAIKAAAHMIISESISLSEYDTLFSTREMIRKYPEIKIIDRDGEDYTPSVANVFDMNFETFDDDERNLLYLLAFFDPDETLTTTLIKGSSKSSRADLDFVKNTKRFLECRKSLISSSFVTWNGNTNSMSMHRIVREICHIRMNEAERQQAFGRAESILHCAYPVPERHFRHRPDLWPEQQRLLVHVQALGSFYQESHETEAREAPLQAGLEFADVCAQAARFLYEHGTFEQSYTLLEIAEVACAPLKDAEAIRADINGGKGSLATETNKFQEAYDQFKLEFDNIKLALDKGLLTRPTVREAIAQGGIANGLNGLKQYAEAEKEYWKCIDIWQSCPGQATIYKINLSTCLWLQDKLADAEDLLKQIIIDPNDTATYRTGHALYTLGNVQISQAYEFLANGEDEDGTTKFDEAFATHQKTLELFRKVLKDHHHKTADAFHKVGWHMHRLQRYPEAIEHMKKALDIYAGSHFYQNEIARTKYKLGCVLRDAGNEVQGRQTLLDAEDLRREILGSDCQPARTEDDYNDLVMFWSR